MAADERWVATVAEGPALRLDRAALLIADRVLGGIDVEAELARLDALAAGCDPGDLASVTGLLFGRIGLRGDTDTYDDPRNSALPAVLDRARGIPISLAVLTMEVGRRVGVTIEGVGMPGHFLVRHRAGPGGRDLLLDPFAAGRPLEVAEARAIFARLQGSDAGWSEGRMLAATPPLEIVARMLANLTASYTRRGELAGRRWVAELRSALPDRSPAAGVHLASELAETGAFAEAATLIDRTAADLDDAGDDPDAARLRSRARAVRARLN